MATDSNTIKLETTFLIIGAGPAGASLACFLASHGLTGLMLAAADGTSKEPRAHITNPATLECFRDIGLEDDLVKATSSAQYMEHTLWSHDMCGDEYARVRSWGHQPHRHGDYDAASPCHHIDLPQSLFEPVLIRYATHNGWKIRFSSQFIEYHLVEGSNQSIVSTIKDLITNQIYQIRSKYLFGCDGARSQVIRQLGLPLIRKPGKGMAMNFVVHADLSEHREYRNGNLYMLLQPDVQHPPWGWICLARMVKPWHEWVFSLYPEPGYVNFDFQPEPHEYEKRLREFIGDDTIPMKVTDVSKWRINEVIAEKYSDGNIFCLGDAVHRHPPPNGLGSNTCVQDAYNLAWKLAYVERGWADKAILTTYNAERQPVGNGIVERANQALREQLPIWQALGGLHTDVEERRKQFAEMSATTLAGRERRKLFMEGIESTERAYGGIGVEMNLLYSSTAIYTEDETNPRPKSGLDPVINYQISTYPGSRLPHAWINSRKPVAAPISTHDLAGKGTFCLFTGPGGNEWREAAQKVLTVLGIRLQVYSIGWKQDWEDVYGEWAKRREVEEDGCVLVRPDRIVCWRSTTLGESPVIALMTIMNSVLSKQ